ncbi:MAG TPA: hypothetical protein VFK54_01380 [Candidatus Limnocylindrales bacterium]|nr:hypothetical protein [Candidatus Limnocylindrales bacterium]
MSLAIRRPRDEHARVLELLGPAPAFPPDASDRDAVESHLGACRSCADRAVQLRRDAAAIAALDAGPTPDHVLQRIEAAMHVARPSLSPAIALAILALLTVAVLGASVGVGGLLSPSVLEPPAVDMTGKALRWETERVALGADRVVIDAGGRTFVGAGTAAPGGDPGSAARWTLELMWLEHGMEQRLFLYFGADDAHWWIDEIRLYDAAAGREADWASLPPGPYARTPFGRPWSGTLDVVGEGRTGPVRVRIEGAVLVTVPKAPLAGRRVEAGRDPFRAGGELECSGILQMTPREAERAIRSLGYAVSWRWNYATGPGTGYSEVRDEAPATGFISGTAPGVDGELIVFVEDPDRPMGQPVPWPARCGPTPAAP